MLLIPLEADQMTIASGFRKSILFVFIDKDKGIVFQENHYKHDKSTLFFENFVKYDVDTIYVKALGYKTYLRLVGLGVKVYLVDEVEKFTHIEPNNLVLLTQENAEGLCVLGHKG
jgi:predicted Fe-Mo cluster-binding NifX family protein